MASNTHKKHRIGYRGTRTPNKFIPIIFQVAGVLAAFVTRPVHGPRLCEAAANSVQICSGQICHPNYLPV
ncbi:hypothetical protein DVP46_05360 [Yersinia enterocolitica]|nr:hypothetical protein [Yersinia enterocolitica]EKN6336561.1 hypothetical protein [Yersinia enterocolitica]EKN6340274.1 hypothetical protein [Yersinia enterocolitica]